MNIQEQLNSLIRGNPLSVDTYLREVCKNEHISDTKASMHIYMLKLDGNNRPRTCDFCDYLINRIVDYCIPPSEIRKAKEKDAEYNTTQYTATLFRKAERLFTDLGNTGEVGELALSVLTQSFLHMPQVLCKMVLKTDVHHRAEFRRDLPLVYFVVVADVQFDKPSGIVVNDLIKVASIHCAYPPVYRHEMCQGNF